MASTTLLWPTGTVENKMENLTQLRMNVTVSNTCLHRLYIEHSFIGQAVVWVGDSIPIFPSHVLKCGWEGHFTSHFTL